MAPEASATSKICPISFSVSPSHLLSTLERSSLTSGLSSAVAKASAVIDLPVPGNPDNSSRYPTCLSVNPAFLARRLNDSQRVYVLALTETEHYPEG